MKFQNTYLLINPLFRFLFAYHLFRDTFNNQDW
jgi:hypothetical protein